MAMWLSTRIRRHGYALLSVPALLWLAIFFILPLVIVFAISLMSRGLGGLPEFPLTTANYERVLTVYRDPILRSILWAFYTMILCLVIGYPMAYFIRTRKSTFAKNAALFFIILPFWTNFMIRIYAWRFLLGKEGVINNFLLNIGLISEPIKMLNTEFAVLLGLVYGYLPFMVLPIYASLERFDFRFSEAANDLGANAWHTFWRIMLPMTMPGIVAGCALVFIPCIGTYVAPAMLGGTSGVMIGTLLENQLKGASGSLPLGAAISMVLLFTILIPVTFYLRSNRES